MNYFGLELKAQNCHKPMIPLVAGDLNRRPLGYEYADSGNYMTDEAQTAFVRFAKTQPGTLRIGICENVSAV